MVVSSVRVLLIVVMVVMAMVVMMMVLIVMMVMMFATCCLTIMIAVRSENTCDVAKNTLVTIARAAVANSD